MGVGYPGLGSGDAGERETGQGLCLCPYCVLMPHWAAASGEASGVGRTPGAGGALHAKGALTTDAERAKAPGQD